MFRLPRIIGLKDISEENLITSRIVCWEASEMPSEYGDGNRPSRSTAVAVCILQPRINFAVRARTIRRWGSKLNSKTSCSHGCVAIVRNDRVHFWLRVLLVDILAMLLKFMCYTYIRKLLAKKERTLRYGTLFKRKIKKRLLGRDYKTRLRILRLLYNLTSF